jgi:hypothetical protein
MALERSHQWRDGGAHHRGDDELGQQSSRDGAFHLVIRLKIVGWITAAVMALCVVGLIASLAL